jgi:hypothetical protein
MTVDGSAAPPMMPIGDGVGSDGAPFTPNGDGEPCVTGRARTTVKPV